MKKIAETVSYLALALVVVAPSLFYAEKITLEASKQLLLLATIVWFASTPLWMGRKREG